MEALGQVKNRLAAEKEKIEAAKAPIGAQTKWDDPFRAIHFVRSSCLGVFMGGSKNGCVCFFVG